MRVFSNRKFIASEFLMARAACSPRDLIMEKSVSLKGSPLEGLATARTPKQSSSCTRGAKIIDLTDKDSSWCLITLGSSGALGIKTGFAVLATSPTTPSSASKISEFKIFSINLALGISFCVECPLIALCGGKRPSTATPFNLPLGSFS